MKERCGNDGAVESVESQRQASHSFHEPLGNRAKRRRDSHISTAPTTRADGKVENQKQVFHFPTAPIPLSQNNTKTAAGFARQHSMKGDSGGTPTATISGSSRIGMQAPFQAHLALESILDFRLISGLENAGTISIRRRMRKQMANKLVRHCSSVLASCESTNLMNPQSENRLVDVITFQARDNVKVR